ncbi:MAG: hypothetical protein H6851_01500 [Geminicoccaceae bacterium]|nr:hypothetical protein [Geminicoccaceae bacterium]MCB9942285.1 hypothetical protein [Geminicoccaceae bacterium]
MFDIPTQAVGGSVGAAQATATGVNDINSLLDLQWQQGLQLAQVQAQSGMISNLVQALNGVARNVRAG